MIHKRVLAIAPIMACPTFMSPFRKTINRFFNNRNLNLIDPLTENLLVDNTQFYADWEKKLFELSSQFDCLVGFSLGGVIIQQSFPILAKLSKSPKIMIFSTPSFVNKNLKVRLEEVINLAQQNKLQEAHKTKMKYVLAPHQKAIESTPFTNPKLAKRRLISGLKRILSTSSHGQVTSPDSPTHVHFIGNNSILVNRDNVCVSPNGKLLNVPNAGMRVLEDNSKFCKEEIREYFYE